MTIEYLDCANLTTCDAQTAWAATATAPAITAHQLPQISETTLAAGGVDLLSELLTIFRPDLDAAAAQEIASATLADLFKGKAQLTLSAVKNGVAYGEFYQQPTMTARDLSAKLYLALLAHEQALAGSDAAEPVLLATDPELLISLAEFLPDTMRLIGFFAPAQLRGFQQHQLAAAFSKPQIKLYQLEAPLSSAELEKIVDKDHFHQLAQANNEVLHVLDGTQFSLLLGQIYSLLTISQQAAAPVHLAGTTHDFSLALAAYYAQQLGAPITGLTIALPQLSPLAEFFENGTPALPAVIAVNLQRLWSNISGRAVGANELADNVALQAAVSDFLTIAVRDREAIMPAIRRAQSQQQMTIGPAAALAAAALDPDTSELQVVLAIADPFQTPDEVLEGITGRVDGKKDFESAQILRQVVAAPMPRVITHLKGQKLPEFHHFSHGQIADELAAWLDQ